MFDPKAEVPFLELCQRLKELGYPQDKTGFWWGYRAHSKDDEQYVLLFGNKILVGELNWWKAPTCRELIEWIDVAYQKHITSCYLTEKLTYTPEEIEPNRLAEDLIWLRENGYVEFEGVKR